MFRGLYDQAQTQTDIRYGAQRDALAQILGGLDRNFTRQSEAQRTAGMTLTGALRGQKDRLGQAYTDAGLTPTLLAQIGNSPTGQRLAGDYARSLAAADQQMQSAMAGQQFLQQRLADDYRDDVGQVQQQAQSLAREQGLFQEQRLSDLIGANRAARSQVRAASREQAHADQQKVLDRDLSRGNALIGAGLNPETGEPLPARSGSSRRTSGPGTASRDKQNAAGSQFDRALANATSMVRGKDRTPELRQRVASELAAGSPASGGQAVYDEVEELDAAGRPTGRTKRVPRLNDDGTKVVTPKRPAIAPVEQSIASAASEQAMFGYVTTATVRKLQKLGYSVNQIPGLTTEHRYRRSRPQPRRPVSRPRNAPSGVRGQSRPT